MNPWIEINGNPWESIKCINSINSLIKMLENQLKSMKLEKTINPSIEIHAYPRELI